MLGIWRKFIPVREVRHLKRLPGEDLDLSGLRVFKTRLAALSSLR